MDNAFNRLMTVRDRKTGKQVPRSAAQVAATLTMRATTTRQREPGAGVVIPIGLKQPTTPGRNKPCPCGSGRKYKKCCLAKENGTYKYPRSPSKLPRQKPDLPDTQVPSTEAPAGKNMAAVAMINAGVDQRVVWAYLETGLYITEINKAAHPAESLATWETALEQYDNASDDDRRIMLVDATVQESE